MFTEFTRIKLKGKNVPKAVPWITTICEVCGVSFDRPPAFHRSAEAKGGKVRFCGTKCFGAAKSDGLVRPSITCGKISSACEMCGKIFERWPSSHKWHKAHGSAVRFCSQACHGAARTARLIRLPQHASEANRRKSDKNRAAWGLPPHDPKVMNLAPAVRARIARGIGFNASQIRNWLSTSCAKCGGSDRLQLDHIICMAAGGKSERENAQTLCMPCHRWKKVHEDKPLVRQQSLSGGQLVRYASETIL